MFWGITLCANFRVMITTFLNVTGRRLKKLFQDIIARSRVGHKLGGLEKRSSSSSGEVSEAIIRSETNGQTIHSIIHTFIHSFIHSYIHSYIQASFSFIFAFSIKHYNFYNKCVKKCPSSIWYWDSNSLHSKHESPPITTRSWLPPIHSIISIHG